jgi:hypothetical protein
MKYVSAQWFLGGTEKTATVSIGVTKLVPPEGAILPESIPEIGVSLSQRPPAPPIPPVGLAAAPGEISLT